MDVPLLCWRVHPMVHGYTKRGRNSNFFDGTDHLSVDCNRGFPTMDYFFYNGWLSMMNHPNMMIIHLNFVYVRIMLPYWLSYSHLGNLTIVEDQRLVTAWDNSANSKIHGAKWTESGDFISSREPRYGHDDAHDDVRHDAWNLWLHRR